MLTPPQGPLATLATGINECALDCACIIGNDGRRERERDTLVFPPEFGRAQNPLARHPEPQNRKTKSPTHPGTQKSLSVHLGSKTVVKGGQSWTLNPEALNA